MKVNSSMNMADVVKYISPFCPIKLYYNSTLIWDDCVDADVAVPLNVALLEFEKKTDALKNIIIHSVKIEIVDFHHSIIYLTGVER